MVCGKPLELALTLRSVLLGASLFAASLLAYLRRKRSTATGGVQQLLLAGEERMAGGADFYVQVAPVG